MIKESASSRASLTQSYTRAPRCGVEFSLFLKVSFFLCVIIIFKEPFYGTRFRRRVSAEHKKELLSMISNNDGQGLLLVKLSKLRIHRAVESLELNGSVLYHQPWTHTRHRNLLSQPHLNCCYHRISSQHVSVLKKKDTNRNQPTTPIVCVVGFSRALRVCERHKFHPNLTGRDSPRTEGYECETPLYTFWHFDRAPRGRRFFFSSVPEGTEKEQKLSPEEPVFGVSGQTLRS